MIAKKIPDGWHCPAVEPWYPLRTAGQARQWHPSLCGYGEFCAFCVILRSRFFIAKRWLVLFVGELLLLRFGVGMLQLFLVRGMSLAKALRREEGASCGWRHTGRPLEANRCYPFSLERTRKELKAVYAKALAKAAR